MLLVMVVEVLVEMVAEAFTLLAIGLERVAHDITGVGLFILLGVAPAVLLVDFCCLSRS